MKRIADTSSNNKSSTTGKENSFTSACMCLKQSRKSDSTETIDKIGSTSPKVLMPTLDVTEHAEALNLSNAESESHIAQHQIQDFVEDAGSDQASSISLKSSSTNSNSSKSSFRKASVHQTVSQRRALDGLTVSNAQNVALSGRRSRSASSESEDVGHSRSESLESEDAYNNILKLNQQSAQNYRAHYSNVHTVSRSSGSSHKSTRQASSRKHRFPLNMGYHLVPDHIISNTPTRYRPRDSHRSSAIRMYESDSYLSKRSLSRRLSVSSENHENQHAQHQHLTDQQIAHHQDQQENQYDQVTSSMVSESSTTHTNAFVMMNEDEVSSAYETSARKMKTERANDRQHETCHESKSKHGSFGSFESFKKAFGMSSTSLSKKDNLSNRSTIISSNSRSNSENGTDATRNRKDNRSFLKKLFNPLTRSLQDSYALGHNTTRLNIEFPGVIDVLDEDCQSQKHRAYVYHPSNSASKVNIAVPDDCEFSATNDHASKDDDQDVNDDSSSTFTDARSFQEEFGDQAEDIQLSEKNVMSQYASKPAEDELTYLSDNRGPLTLEAPCAAVEDGELSHCLSATSVTLEDGVTLKMPSPQLDDEKSCIFNEDAATTQDVEALSNNVNQYKDVADDLYSRQNQDFPSVEEFKQDLFKTVGNNDLAAKIADAVQLETTMHVDDTSHLVMSMVTTTSTTEATESERDARSSNASTSSSCTNVSAFTNESSSSSFNTCDTHARSADYEHRAQYDRMFKSHKETIKTCTDGQTTNVSLLGQVCLNGDLISDFQSAHLVINIDGKPALKIKNLQVLLEKEISSVQSINFGSKIKPKKSTKEKRTSQNVSTREHKLSRTVETQQTQSSSRNRNVVNSFSTSQMFKDMRHHNQEHKATQTNSHTVGDYDSSSKSTSTIDLETQRCSSQTSTNFSTGFFEHLIANETLKNKESQTLKDKATHTRASKLLLRQVKEVKEEVHEESQHFVITKKRFVTETSTSEEEREEDISNAANRDKFGTLTASKRSVRTFEAPHVEDSSDTDSSTSTTKKQKVDRDTASKNSSKFIYTAKLNDGWKPLPMMKSFKDHIKQQNTSSVLSLFVVPPHQL